MVSPGELPALHRRPFLVKDLIMAQANRHRTLTGLTRQRSPCSQAAFRGICAVALCFQASSCLAEAASAQVLPFIHSVVLVDVLPDRTREALPLLRRYAADTRRQPGCVAFDLVEERPSMSNHFAMLATWRTDGERKAYGGTNGALTFRNALQLFTASPVDERIYVDVVP